MADTFLAKDIVGDYYLHHKKILWNVGAVSYILGGYLSAIALLVSAKIWLNRFKDLAQTHIFHHVHKLDSEIINLPTFINHLYPPIRYLAVCR